MNKKTEIVCILDRSGSMDEIINDAIGGFNSFIEEQRKIDGEASVTIVLFDHEYKLLKDNINLKKIKPLTKDDWIPRGTTALYDAIGKTIITVKERHKKMKKKDRPKVIVCIVTDGMENDSKEYNNNTIMNLINKQKEKKKWGFIYLAANQDAFAVGNSLGIGKGSILTFVADSNGVNNYSAAMTRSVAAYRQTNLKDIDIDKLISDKK